MSSPKVIRDIEDRLKLSGGTLTGSLFINNGYAYAAGSADESIFLSRRNFNDEKYSRYISISSKENIAINSAITFVERNNDVWKTYKLYGEHNKPTAKDVEALAWCPNEDVNTSPSILAVVNSMNTGGSFFAVQGSSIINASDSPSPGAEFHYFVLMDTQLRKRVIAHHYNDGGFNIFTRRVFSGSWLDGDWVNLGTAFSNADTVDGYHGWEFARTAFTPSNNMNDLTFSGMYRLNSGMTNHASGMDWGQMLVVRGGGDTIAQVGFDFSLSRAWLRTGNPPECSGAGAWRPWYQFYTTGNIQKGSSSVPSDLQEDGIYIKY